MLAAHQLCGRPTKARLKKPVDFLRIEPMKRALGGLIFGELVHSYENGSSAVRLRQGRASSAGEMRRCYDGSIWKMV